MWYGRSRSDGSDYTRMGRQKCLLQAIAKQANPTTVLTKFNKLARATKRAVATDIPQGLLPPLIDLSAKFKNGAQIRSVQFVPPLINPALPDFRLIRKKVNAALAPPPPKQPDAAAAGPADGSQSGSPAGKRKRKAAAANQFNLNCAT